VDLDDEELPDRVVHLQAALDTAFLHFAGVILEYSPPDRIVPHSKLRGRASLPRRESVRLVSARLFDLERKVVQVAYDTENGLKITVQQHPEKRKNDFELAAMAQACGTLLAGWKALWMSSEPPLSVVIENPKKQKSEHGGGWNGPPNQYAISAVPFAAIGALDKMKGLQVRTMEYRQAKADVKRGSPYLDHKNEAIERMTQVLTKNNDKGGLQLLEEMTTQEWKLDDVADAFLLALKAARNSCHVTDKWLARVKERHTVTVEEEPVMAAIPSKKRKRKDMDGCEPKRARKE
jgi:hypothetical protein